MSRQTRNLALLLCTFVIPMIPALAAAAVGMPRAVGLGAFLAFFAVMLVFFLNQRCPHCGMAYHLSLKPPGVYHHLVPVECPHCHESLS